MISKLKKIVQCIYRKYNHKKDRYHIVGGMPLLLPPYHNLDVYQFNFLNYDKKISIITKLISEKYPYSSCIDIGANIGDTAFAIRSAAAGPIYCVEGNPSFLPYLKKNIDRLHGQNIIVPYFIKPEKVKPSSFFSINEKNGTACLALDEAGLGNTIFNNSISCKELMLKASEISPVCFIKTDTDGFDFLILDSLLENFGTAPPILFFEFDPFIGNSTPKDAIEVIDKMVNLGFVKFVAYDNFGNYAWSGNLVLADIEKLINGLYQKKMAGGGTYYYDFCVFTSNDADIFEKLVEIEFKI